LESRYRGWNPYHHHVNTSESEVTEMVRVSRFSKVMSAIVVAGFLSSNILAASSPATADASGATVSGLVQSQFGSNPAQNLVGVPVELEYKVDS
jgi:hypothetical protein